MDSRCYYSTDTPSSSSEGKKVMKQQHVWVEEEDLLGMLSQRDLNNGSMVDCSLSLGPPGTTPGTLPTSTSVVKPLPPHPSPQASVPPMQLGSTFHSEVCTMCAATETPLWRRGPYGPKSLCNACGIRYKKEERRLSLSLGVPNSQTKAHREHQKTNN